MALAASLLGLRGLRGAERGLGTVWTSRVRVFFAFWRGSLGVINLPYIINIIYIYCFSPFLELFSNSS